MRHALSALLLVALGDAWLVGGPVASRRSQRAPPVRLDAANAGAADAEPQDDLSILPALGELLQPLPADQIVTDEWDLSGGVVDDGPGSFVELFRSSTPYIKMHQATTMVLHIDSKVLDREELFDMLMDDIALLAVLGVRPVLVVSIREQVDARLLEMGVMPRYNGAHRISDAVVMRVVQEVSGFARARTEGALARGRSRGRGTGVGIDVVGGNFHYTAQPIGVRNGVDFGSTGEVRRVEVEKIRSHLNNGEIVLMNALGYSASGDVFNVKSEEVASRTASALGASKLIYLTLGKLTAPAGVSVSSSAGPPSEAASEGGDGVPPQAVGLIQSMRLGDAKRLVERYRREVAEAMAAAEAQAAAGLPDDENLLYAAQAYRGNASSSAFALCGYCVDALERGVTRAHLVPPVPGALLQELYTLDGTGTLISRDLYDGIRRGVPEDTSGIIELIAPLEAAGILVERPRAELARDVHAGFYYVFTRDGAILGVAMLKRYSETSAELGCLVVSPQYRRQGTGDAMLGFLERTAVAAGVQQIFALSTHTMQWFAERGFDEVTLDELPPSRQVLYNHKRNSKIYSKALTTSRSVDADELFWSAKSR